MSDYQPHQYVSMELEVTSVTAKEFDLYLSLKFTPQWQNLGKGRLQLSVQGGNLRLKLDHTQIIRVISQPQPGWDLIASQSNGELVWLVKSQQLCQKCKLGTFAITTEDYQITASFAALPGTVSLNAIEGLWRHDLSPNKHAILDRKLALCLYKNILFGEISVVNKENQSKQFTPPELTPETLIEIEKLIDDVYGAKTDNFTELMALFDLNPLVDLGGGKFSATRLSGITLSGANLSLTQWRGADLTDADLSEADLSDANLAGADISGAYLGNANLQRTDLHRASLALANLIGANLTNANLKETNLTKTNLSSAIVSGTVLQQNLGLSEGDKQSLLQRGAILQ